MAQTNVNIRLDEDVKQQFNAVCEELGMSMSTAFNIFAKAVVRKDGFPFDLSLERPNAETLTAIEEVNAGRGLTGPFRSRAALKESLDA